MGKWWTEEVSGDIQSGGQIEFKFTSKTGELLGKMVMQVEELKAPVNVRWKCVEGPPE